jgi:lipoprotein-releasing system permease protein
MFQYKLSLGIGSFGEPLQIMVPKPGTGFINPNNAFYKMNAQIVGLYAGTEEFESKFVFNVDELHMTGCGCGTSFNMK